MSSFYIYGSHSVREAIKNSHRQIYKIFCIESKREECQQWLKAAGRKVEIVVTDKRLLDQQLSDQFGQAVHQGIVASIELLSHKTLEQIHAKHVVLLDQIQDVRNIGAILRCAASFDIQDVICVKAHMPDLNNPALYAQLAKAASGACEYVSIVQVSNLSNAIDILKKRNYWILGLDENGSNIKECTNFEKIGLIIGQEGEGLRQLTREKCDVICSIPTSKSFNCLNASVAAGIGMYSLFS